MLLMKRPPDAASDLQSPDRSGQRRPLLKATHERLPRLWTMLPRKGIILWPEQGHDTITDENHGCEVLPASRFETHICHICVPGLLDSLLSFRCCPG